VDALVAKQAPPPVDEQPAVDSADAAVQAITADCQLDRRDDLAAYIPDFITLLKPRHVGSSRFARNSYLTTLTPVSGVAARFHLIISAIPRDLYRIAPD
jgi:hypothetical protein